MASRSPPSNGYHRSSSPPPPPPPNTSRRFRSRSRSRDDYTADYKPDDIDRQLNVCGCIYAAVHDRCNLLAPEAVAAVFAGTTELQEVYPGFNSRVVEHHRREWWQSESCDRKAAFAAYMTWCSRESATDSATDFFDKSLDGLRAHVKAKYAFLRPFFVMFTNTSDEEGEEGDDHANPIVVV